MSYKSVVVHLDTSGHAHARLELALRVAKQFDAHLTGLFSIFEPDPRSFYVVAGTADYYREQEGLRAERRTALEHLFRAELGRAQIKGEWITADEYANIAVPRRGRCSDLIIAGQDDLSDPECYVGEHFQENLVMSAGRPVLLVPYAGVFHSAGTHVMVAWDGSREATRAVHDALPFIMQANRTTVVTVNGEPGVVRGSRMPGADIATVIARHGAKVDVTDIEAGAGLSIGDVLLSHLADLGADLLVMGAYGHARWQELVMGGATRTLLKSMTVPVLMSH